VTLQVWQLPDVLIPLALSFFQLQRGPLMSLAAAAAADAEWHGSSSSSSSNSEQAVSTAQHSTADPLMAGSWRTLQQQFMQCAPGTALRMVAPWLYVFDPTSSQFDVLPPLNLALEPDALAVLDCGSEVIIYVGKVLMALVEGLPTPADSTNGAQQQQEQQQQQGQRQGQGPQPPAAPAATNGPAAIPAVAPDGVPAAGAAAAVLDMAEAAAPAVRCAQALVRGRVPVPAIHIVEDTAGMVNLVRRLVPLHEDPVALQILLLPHLNDISPMQHGYLLDWHKHWAGVAAAAQQQGVSVRAGGARLANFEAAKGQELSFGSWYSSFGVVLKSPAGALAKGELNLEVE
jgi:hypothetical protein